ncbi:MAG: hypothetical protein IJ564_00680, partial [Alphaproteobacteria bacterium]|nr:hypothetical protein [Alphaproteobacteria bacterium]
PHFFVAPHPATPNNTKKAAFRRPLVLLEKSNGIGFAAPALIGFADRHPKVCLSLVVGPTSSWLLILCR